MFKKKYLNIRLLEKGNGAGAKIKKKRREQSGSRAKLNLKYVRSGADVQQIKI